MRFSFRIFLINIQRSLKRDTHKVELEEIEDEKVKIN